MPVSLRPHPAQTTIFLSQEQSTHLSQDLIPLPLIISFSLPPAQIHHQGNLHSLCSHPGASPTCLSRSHSLLRIAGPISAPSPPFTDLSSSLICKPLRDRWSGSHRVEISASS
ncbi:hypothetical protein MRB53_025325 [Persea americana]|uniref:Uncharacterized protein n=1 Tax=Persea americana TaxID=3435 RepID=A0ACC2LEW1_PERAE|nr:hypothetical protein MRB53_025325 [Persea americana]